MKLSVHKYEFVNRESGVHTQHVESFNNILKYSIKNKKGVLTDFRGKFLKEECFFWNNKERIIEALLDLIKIN